VSAPKTCTLAYVEIVGVTRIQGAAAQDARSREAARIVKLVFDAKPGDRRLARAQNGQRRVAAGSADPAGHVSCDDVRSAVESADSRFDVGSAGAPLLRVDGAVPLHPRAGSGGSERGQTGRSERRRTPDVIDGLLSHVDRD
jgi:hypothetical protein